MPEQTEQDMRETGSHSQPPKKNPYRFAEGVSIGLVAHFVAPATIALASTIWLYLEKDPSIPWPTLFIFLALIITAAYLSLISMQFFFSEDVKLSHRPRVHFILFAIIIVTVTAPLALLQTLTSIRANELEIK